MPPVRPPVRAYESSMSNHYRMLHWLAVRGEDTTLAPGVCPRCGGEGSRAVKFNLFWFSVVTRWLFLIMGPLPLMLAKRVTVRAHFCEPCWRRQIQAWVLWLLSAATVVVGLVAGGVLLAFGLSWLGFVVGAVSALLGAMGMARSRRRNRLWLETVSEGWGLLRGVSDEYFRNAQVVAVPPPAYVAVRETDDALP